MRLSGIALPVTNSGDISQATLTAGPLDKRSLDQVVIVATITGASVAGALQLYGIIGPPSGDSTAPNGLSWPSSAKRIPIGSPVTFTAAGTTCWDLSKSGFSAYEVGWAKSGTSTGTLAVTFNGN